MEGLNRRDNSLLTQLASYSTTDKDFWSFRGNAARQHAHIYFQYPAMMVPQMQAELLRAAISADPTIRHVFDPFVGSGTALTESMMLGLDFTGRDVNPLAVLLCRAKSIPHYCRAIVSKIAQTLTRVRQDHRNAYEAHFPRRNKWFRRDVIIMLSRIRRAIRAEPRLWARRFLWVAMAETVRLTSNARTSTFKLHIRPAEDCSTRRIDVLDTFEAISMRNAANLNKQKIALSQKGLLNSGVYKGTIRTMLGDTSNSEAASNTFENADLLLTSPPYGDNVSTIPYGQHSFLPLQWIDFSDIDPKLDASYLQSTHEIDFRSLGGSRVVSEDDIHRLCTLSDSFAQTIALLESAPRDRSIRVAAFCRDLERTVDPIFERLRPGALMFWIVGNRRVAGQIIPLDDILLDLLITRDAQLICRISRRIHTKRSALRNQIAPTMRRETVLVLRKVN